MSAWSALLVCAVAVGAAQARERRREVIAARARHEVRGPLAAARLALEGAERSARVQAADAELRRAARALDELARGRPEPEAMRVVDAGAVAREAAAPWPAVAVEAAGPPLLVRADAVRLTQACANLVANAVEHGAPPVRVRVTGDGARVRIEVADGGPGLPAPLPALLVAARGRRTPRGHGLAIVAGIAERHGGTLTAGPGARLALELPAAGHGPRLGPRPTRAPVSRSLGAARRLAPPVLHARPWP